MLVIGTALFDSAPWKNLIVNGLVLAACVASLLLRKIFPPEKLY
jgi:hypothetical protein